MTTSSMTSDSESLKCLNISGPIDPRAQYLGLRVRLKDEPKVSSLGVELSGRDFLLLEVENTVGCKKLIRGFPIDRVTEEQIDEYWTLIDLSTGMFDRVLIDSAGIERLLPISDFAKEF